MIVSALAFLGRHGPGLLAGGIFVGLAWPALAAALHPWLPALVFCLAVAAMVRLEWRALAAHIRQPGRIALVLVWGLVASPVVTAAVVAPLGLPAGLAHAIVIWSASPALISSPALAYLLGLDAALALIVMVGGSLLMPLTLPPLVLGLLGVTLDIGVAALMLRLGLFIGGAIVAAAVARRLIGPVRVARLGDAINGGNVVLLMLFAVAIMDGMREVAASRPAELALTCVAAAMAALVQQLLGTLVFLAFGRVPALTIGMVCGNRNMASVWASLGTFATPELTLFLVALQLPIYLLPAVLRPLYRRLGGASRPR